MEEDEMDKMCEERGFNLYSTSGKTRTYLHSTGACLEVSTDGKWVLRYNVDHLPAELRIGPCGSFDNGDHFNGIFNRFNKYVNGIKFVDNQWIDWNEVMIK